MNSKSMVKGVFSWIKTLASAVLVILLLKYTGLFSYVTQATQSVAIETGLLDASTEAKEKEEFDYDFTIKNLNGETLSFEHYKGKVIFLNLWATWCGPCKVEMPAIQKLYESVGSDSIVFVMLSIDRERDQYKVLKYIQEKAYTFPVFLKSGDLTDQLNVPAIPTTFIIGKNGKIVSKEVGTTNFNTPKFKKYLKDLAK
ncbi:MAG: TlpA family protein disulfide reductase [Cytophagales bacterium]